MWTHATQAHKRLFSLLKALIWARCVPTNCGTRVPVAYDKTEIDKAFDRLESIVRSRDSREITDEGDFVRSFSHGVADVLAIATAFLLTTVGLLSPASMTPKGWWTVAACTGTIALAHTVRRRARHPRLRHVSVAIGATSVGIGAMMLIAIAYEALA